MIFLKTNNMKIWIDLTNSPHINFFKPFIEKWEKENFEIIITARDLANTIHLIEQNGWTYYEIGGHAGKSKIKKLLYFPKRIKDLFQFLKKHNPNIGISHSSFYSPLVCKLLNIPSIYINDNEHAKGNYLAFKFATINFLPEFLSEKAKEFKWTKKYRFLFYPGVKEGIYLSQAVFSNNRINNFNSHSKRKIFIRLEPWSAQYYAGNSDFMDPIIAELSINYKVIILPRSKEQVTHFSKQFYNNIEVVQKPLKIEEIFNECYFFIGAGGSMTREMAILGVPTLSVYQGELLEVDKYLIRENLMYYNNKPNVDYIINLMGVKNGGSNTKIFNKGNQAFELINEQIKKLWKKN
jgi:predicted glycosyltransferase